MLGVKFSSQHSWYGEPEQRLGDRLLAQTRIFRSVKIGDGGFGGVFILGSGGTR
jgi:hypothetical protein